MPDWEGDTISKEFNIRFRNTLRQGVGDMVGERKPAPLFILVFLILFLSIGAIARGGGLVLGPKGSIIPLPLNLLDRSPFSDYLIPGLILLLFIGVLPAVVFYGLLKKPNWKWIDVLNVYKDRHWSWTFAIFTGILLILWMDFQIMWVGYGAFIQMFCSFLAVLILGVALLPSVKEYFKSATK
jgi:hypothetical protein